MPGRTIAVLDDSPLVLELTKDLLTAAGHRVVTAASAVDFLSLMQKEKPDLALVDISMPVVEGDSVVGIATAQGLRSCPIVLYSSKGEKELKKLVRSCGADGYIMKTNDAAVLTAAIARYLPA